MVIVQLRHISAEDFNQNLSVDTSTDIFWHVFVRSAHQAIKELYKAFENDSDMYQATMQADKFKSTVDKPPASTMRISSRQPVPIDCIYRTNKVLHQV